jgi:hypothetical protein
MDHEQRREDHNELRKERKARGDVRDAYLEAGRRQAHKENNEARERTQAEPQSDADRIDAEQEAERKATRAADEITMKGEARSRYEGTDEAFEREWPAMRQQMLDEGERENLERVRRRL